MDLISLFDKSDYLLTDINEFLEEVREKFYDLKQKEGKSENEIRQAWVSFMGHNLENIFEVYLKAFCKEHNLKLTKDKKLRKKNLSKELSEVKRKISINFGSYMLLPDADLIIYKTNPVEVLFIFSIKNSFRERYTETPYWKLKLLEDSVTKHIKVFLITPDKDNEISFKKPKKARIVLEYELDGIYLAKDFFEGSEKVKSIKDLIVDLKKYLKEFNEQFENS